MKNVFLIGLLALAACNSVSVQSSNYSLDKYRLNKELNALLESKQDGGMVATKYSFVSEYQKLLEALDVNADTIEAIRLSDWQEIQNTYRFEDATNFILLEGKDHDF